MDKILVIEDSKVSQIIVREFMGRKYELEFRDDGPSGIASAKSNLPDLILLDIHLPQMDGFEVCRILKGEEKTREIPVIFITSMNSEMDKVKGFEAGAEDYIVKPFFPQELLARVKLHLASRRALMQAVELERLNVFKEMAVALSHEINNPLTAIYAYLHVINREAADAPRNIKEPLQGIHDELARIREITGKLAQASKAVKTCYSRDITMIDLRKI